MTPLIGTGNSSPISGFSNKNSNGTSTAQAYLKRREENFAVLDRIAEKTKGYDLDFIDAQIEKAVW